MAYILVIIFYRSSTLCNQKIQLQVTVVQVAPKDLKEEALVNFIGCMVTTATYHC